LERKGEDSRLAQVEGGGRKGGKKQHRGLRVRAAKK